MFLSGPFALTAKFIVQARCDEAAEVAVPQACSLVRIMPNHDGQSRGPYNGRKPVTREVSPQRGKECGALGAGRGRLGLDVQLTTTTSSHPVFTQLRPRTMAAKRRSFLDRSISR